MLQPIPRKILRDTLNLTVPLEVDGYQTVTKNEKYTVNNVHIQPENRTRKTTDNTEITTTATLFIDARRSLPAIDYTALQQTAQDAGAVMYCTITDRRGITSRPYTILIVEPIPDDEGNIHHWELGLV